MLVSYLQPNDMSTHYNMSGTVLASFSEILRRGISNLEPCLCLANAGRDRLKLESP